jgi:octaprenyl-diphosphate synthase
MRQVGENLGMAFQIKDDLLDFGDSSQTGKPTGIDIKEKKMTLPIIYLLNNSNKSGKKKIINTIKKHNNDKAKVNELIETVRKSGGIDYAREKMDEFKNNALELLSKMPDNEARAMLIELVNFTIDRKK